MAVLHASQLRWFFRIPLLADDWAIVAAQVSLIRAQIFARPNLLTVSLYAKVDIQGTMGMSVAGES